jgi:ArsR family transcriptional regulator
MVERPTDVFRALSDPTRLRILHVLRKGELCVGDLVTVLDVPQPTASRHLTLLRKIGLITARKKSYWTFYALAPARTGLRAKLLELLDADTKGRSRDESRLKALRRSGGCCLP